MAPPLTRLFMPELTGATWLTMSPALTSACQQLAYKGFVCQHLIVAILLLKFRQYIFHGSLNLLFPEEKNDILVSLFFLSTYQIENFQRSLFISLWSPDTPLRYSLCFLLVFSFSLQCVTHLQAQITFAKVFLGEIISHKHLLCRLLHMPERLGRLT